MQLMQPSISLNPSRWTLASTVIISLATGLALVACNSAPAQTSESEEQKADGLAPVDLLEGGLNQWRGYKQASVPSGWELQEGILTFDAERGGRGDLISVGEYEDFDLSLEWKVGPGGNSGIFFHVSEDQPATYSSGPEMQILDNELHVDGKDPLTSAGSNYALHAPPEDYTRPVGEFNKARIKVEGARVRHWLNDELVVDYELWTDDWKALVAGSKFRAMPAYGLNRSGHIALQDHGDPVAFRNIKIIDLGSATP